MASIIMPVLTVIERKKSYVHQTVFYFKYKDNEKISKINVTYFEQWKIILPSIQSFEECRAIGFCVVKINIKEVQ